jgi:hypothetical protein
MSARSFHATRGNTHSVSTAGVGAHHPVRLALQAPLRQCWLAYRDQRVRLERQLMDMQG